VPPTAEPPPSPRVDPRVERSQQLVRAAALAELAASGYGAFTIEAVAARAGVARSTVYRHWPDKLTLLVDAFSALNVQPGREPDDRPPRERVVQIVDHLVAAMRDPLRSAWSPALSDAAERDPVVRALHHRINAERRGTLVDAIRAAVEAGVVVPPVDPELASLALAGAVVYARTMTPEPLTADQVPALVDLVLGPAPDRRPRPSRRPGRGSKAG
jgi:TetR/AcrR family transcriptional regulator, regulator of autoinduction and epiphytic fitness